MATGFTRGFEALEAVMYKMTDFDSVEVIREITVKYESDPNLLDKVHSISTIEVAKGAKKQPSDHRGKKGKKQKTVQKEPVPSTSTSGGLNDTISDDESDMSEACIQCSLEDESEQVQSPC